MRDVQEMMSSAKRLNAVIDSIIADMPTLDEQISIARADMGEDRWNELMKEWNDV